MKVKNKTAKNKKALKKRIRVEHLNCRIFNTYKGLSEMRYSKNMNRLYNLCKLATTVQIFEYFEDKTCIDTLSIPNNQF